MLWWRLLMRSNVTSKSMLVSNMNLYGPMRSWAQTSSEALKRSSEASGGCWDCLVTVTAVVFWYVCRKLRCSERLWAVGTGVPTSSSWGRRRCLNSRRGDIDSHKKMSSLWHKETAITGAAVTGMNKERRVETLCGLNSAFQTEWVFIKLLLCCRLSPQSTTRRNRKLLISSKSVLGA